MANFLENSAREVSTSIEQKYCTRDLIDCIHDNKPVVFLKLGDGEYYCANFHQGANCDQDNYTIKKGKALLDTLAFLNDTKNNVYFALWPQYEKFIFWEKQCSRPIRWTNYHSLIIDENDINTKSQALQDKIELYKTIQQSPLKKVFICNILLQKAKILLKIDTLVHIPFSNWFDTDFERILEEVKKEYSEQGTIFMVAAGMGGKPLIGELARVFPNAIYLDIGSALDYLCTQKCSRGNRFTYSQLKEAFQDLLPEDWDSDKYSEIVEQAKIHLGKHLK